MQATTRMNLQAMVRRGRASLRTHMAWSHVCNRCGDLNHRATDWWLLEVRNRRGGMWLKRGDTRGLVAMVQSSILIVVVVTPGSHVTKIE